MEVKESWHGILHWIPALALICIQNFRSGHNTGMAESDEGWAQEQWGDADLGDKRRQARAVRIGAKLMALPGAPLSQQVGSQSELIGAYRFLSNKEVNGQALTESHRKATLAAAGVSKEVILMIQDRTTLDYSSHKRRTAGLGEISTVRERRGALLQAALGVEAESGRILGLAHSELIVRDPERKQKEGRRRSKSAEAQAWERTVEAIGPVPEGATWVYVSDRESDIFEYMEACLKQGAGFILRVFHERSLHSRTADVGEDVVMSLLTTARALPPSTDPAARYTVKVPSTTKAPARDAEVVLGWCSVELRPPWYARERSPLRAQVVRVWEPSPTEGAPGIEWILLTSLTINNAADARQIVKWYEHRWLIEDFNMCLKTGCEIERSQLDHVNDLDRLLGFKLPIAARLLQLRQDVRLAPDVPAEQIVDSIYVRLLRAKLKLKILTMSLRDFWMRVAQLGGHRGRKSDGPPGWRTLWRGWLQLQTLVEGALLLQSST